MDSNVGSVCESSACKENIICGLQRVKWKKHSLKWDSSVMRGRPCSGGKRDEHWHLSRSGTLENSSREVVTPRSKAKQAQERFVLTGQRSRSASGFPACCLRRNRFIHKVTLSGIPTDCVAHYKGQRLWEHFSGERQRNMAASIRGLASEKKGVRRETGWEHGGWGAAKDI